MGGRDPQVARIEEIDAGNTLEAAARSRPGAAREGSKDSCTCEFCAAAPRPGPQLCQEPCCRWRRRIPGTCVSCRVPPAQGCVEPWVVPRGINGVRDVYRGFIFQSPAVSRLTYLDLRISLQLRLTAWRRLGGGSVFATLRYLKIGSVLEELQAEPLYSMFLLHVPRIRLNLGNSAYYPRLLSTTNAVRAGAF